MDIIKIYQYRCAVRGCATKKKRDEKMPLHRFPKKGFWFDWVRACKNEHLSTLDLSTVTSKRFFVCHRHFNEESFYAKRNGQLIPKHGIIPTLNLPNDEDVSFYIDMPDLSSEGFEARVENINIAQSAIYSPSVGRLSIAEGEKPDEKLHSCRKSSLHFREVSNYLLLYRKSENVMSYKFAFLKLLNLQYQILLNLKTFKVYKFQSFKTNGFLMLNNVHFILF